MTSRFLATGEKREDFQIENTDSCGLFSLKQHLPSFLFLLQRIWQVAWCQVSPATLMPCGFSVDELQLDEPFISVQISHSTEPVLKSLAVLIEDPLNLSLMRLI